MGLSGCPRFDCHGVRQLPRKSTEAGALDEASFLQRFARVPSFYTFVFIVASLRTPFRHSRAFLNTPFTFVLFLCSTLPTDLPVLSSSTSSSSEADHTRESGREPTKIRLNGTHSSDSTRQRKVDTFRLVDSTANELGTWWWRCGTAGEFGGAGVFDGGGAVGEAGESTRPPVWIKQ